MQRQGFLATYDPSQFSYTFMYKSRTCFLSQDCLADRPWPWAPHGDHGVVTDDHHVPLALLLT